MLAIVLPLIASAAPPARVELEVVREGRPVSGITVAIDGRSRTTNADGMAALSITPGRRFLEVSDRGLPLLGVDLLVVERERIRGTVVVEDRSARLLLDEDPHLFGVIEGHVRSGSGEPLRSTLRFVGSDVTVRTDRDGHFIVRLPSGVYPVSFDDTVTLDPIRAIPGRRVRADMVVSPFGLALETYGVVDDVFPPEPVYVARNSSLIVIPPLDPLPPLPVTEDRGARSDRTAADAVRRIPGVRVEQGQYVMFRGQPARYTGLRLNGSPLPSVEPHLRSLPLDLLVVGALSGIAVSRTPSADEPVDFGTGAVDLQTRGVPSAPFMDVQLLTALNSTSTFADGQTYRGGGLDFFGFDNGIRALPAGIGEPLATEAQGRSFNGVYNLSTAPRPPDLGLAVAGGTRLPLGDVGQLGVVGGLQFRNAWRTQDRDNFLYGEPPVTETGYYGYYGYGYGPQRLGNERESRTDQDSQLGLVLALNAVWRDHRVSATTLVAHRARQRGQSTRVSDYFGQGVVRESLLEWMERDLVVEQLAGDHRLGPVVVSWRALASRTSRDAPDRREYALLDRFPYGTYFEYTEYGYEPVAVNADRYELTSQGATRDFRSIVDRHRSFGVDVTWAPRLKRPLLGLRVHAGVAGHVTDRRRTSRLFLFQPFDPMASGNPEALFDPSLIGESLAFVDLSQSSRDDYVGTERGLGAYAKARLRVGGRFEVIGGLRYERATTELVTFATNVDEPLAFETGFEQRDACFEGPACALYPSVLGIVRPSRNSELRVSYGRTTGRPFLAEQARTSFTDPDSGETFLGDSLVPTSIQSVDGRLQWTPRVDRSLSIGAFGYGYQSPVERVFPPVGSIGALPTFAQEEAPFWTWGGEIGGRRVFGRVHAGGNLAVLVPVRPERPNNARLVDGQAGFVLDLLGGYTIGRHDVFVMLDGIGRRPHRVGPETVTFQPGPRFDVVWTWDIFETDRQATMLQVRLANLFSPDQSFRQAMGNNFGGTNRLVWRRFRRGVELSAEARVRFR